MVFLKTDYVLLSMEVDGETRVFSSISGKKKALARKKLKIKNLLDSAEQISKNKSIAMTCSQALSYNLANSDLKVFSGTLQGKYIVEIFPNYVNILFM